MLGDLKAFLDVWNALKHVPLGDALAPLGVFGVYWLRKQLASKSWQFIFSTKESQISVQFDRKGNQATKPARRAKSRTRRPVSTNHRKSTRALPSPTAPKRISSDPLIKLDYCCTS